MSGALESLNPISAEGLTATSRLGGRAREVLLYGGLFAAAVGAFCLRQSLGHRLGLVSDLVAVAGDATCGWSWLLVRALFQPVKPLRPAWPLIVVLTLVATGAVVRLSGDSVAPLPRMAGNLGDLVSSTLLLLATIEPLRTLGSQTQQGEQRFRIAFAAGYAALLAVAVIWVDGASTAQGGLTVKSTCAALALLGMAAAIVYRLRHPLPAGGSGARRGQSTDSSGLAAALQRLMAQDAFYTRQNLKVADIARALGQPDYKITRCVTGPLGFRNFNQMANHFRIEEAKRRLVSAAYDHLPILTIAYDCGFGSIGPFNRAFKAQTGLTPQQFRRASSATGRL